LTLSTGKHVGTCMQVGVWGWRFSRLWLWRLLSSRLWHLQSGRERKHTSPKRWCPSTKLHGATFQKIRIIRNTKA